jgi:hypothetical protein
MPFVQEQRVSSRRNATKSGRIDNVLKPQGGHHFYEVLWDIGSLETVSEHDLQPELIIKTPWDLLANNSLNDFRDFSIATTLHKVRNTTSNTISSLKASRTIFKPYQYKPLVKFLKSDSKRILIADEVGLGKTVEAGHIMLEMAARGNLKNALVICPNSLRDKWKAELHDKFNFIMKVYESTSELIQDIKDDCAGANKNIFGILNYEKCRNEELQNTIEENGYSFDLLICDEAHKIRNSETQQNKGVSKIVSQADAAVFLTATPIMTDIRNLYNLLKVLDESYDTFDIFNNAISQNRPFIRALAQIKNQPLQSVAKELHDAKVIEQMTADEEVYFSEEKSIGELFGKDALYLRARENMLKGENTVENKVDIQQDLIDLNSLNHLYIRTRKKDVMSENEVVHRKPKTVTVQLSEGEQIIYDSVINEYSNPDNLGLLQKKRQMSSCIVAFQTVRGDLESGFYDQSLSDSKFLAFNTIVDEVVIKKKKKLIVFAFFTNTLLYLRIKLAELGIASEIIYGGIEDRTERIERFRDEENSRILLSSEVGSEGLDLQFCDAMVNYDLPWNPMVVEQRIGRIDRVGQQSNIINIYNLVILGTIEERIHERLYERINLFRDSIGDLEAILGESESLEQLVKEGIELLYKTKLNEGEQIAELNRISEAIEHERLNLTKVRTDLDDAFANDLSFQNEIENITKNNRYLTKEEIIKYLESSIRLYLSTLRLIHINDKESLLEIPPNNNSILFDFIEKYKDQRTNNPEIDNLYKKFKAKYISSPKITITFDQQHAYMHKSVEYVSAFHPLINSITNCLAANKYDTHQAHKIAVKQDVSGEKGIGLGYYILAIYRITIKKHVSNEKSTEMHLLRCAAADLNGNEIEILNKKVGDYLHGLVQIKGEQLLETFPLDPEAVREIRNLISMEMINEQKITEKDEEVKFMSIIKRRTGQELNYIDKRIERKEMQLAEKKGIATILRNDITELRLRRTQLLENLSNSRVDVNHALISVNLVKVI